MEKKNLQIGFALFGIKVEQFAVFEENYSPKKVTNINTELQYKLNQQGKLIAAFLGFEFTQGKKVFIKILVSCHFIIEDDSWKDLENKDNALIFPKGFVTHLAVITTGTTRGVLYAKTEGTPFSEFIIPMLNVETLITEDVTFTLDKELQE